MFCTKCIHFVYVHLHPAGKQLKLYCWSNFLAIQWHKNDDWFFPSISGEQMKAIVIVAALVLLSFTASPTTAQGMQVLLT